MFSLMTLFKIVKIEHNIVRYNSNSYFIRSQCNNRSRVSE